MNGLAALFDHPVLRNVPWRSLGVPLLVWSVKGPRPDLAESWGEVEDISSLAKLDAASKRLRRVLEEQRVAWVEVDPLTALTLQAKGDCGITPVALRSSRCAMSARFIPRCRTPASAFSSSNPAATSSGAGGPAGGPAAGRFAVVTRAPSFS